LAAPKTTIWDLEPHTAAKHAILGRYLSAWLPILSHGGFPEIVYIDAFAGPGTYSKGEDGSPIIALKALLTHKSPIRATCRFHFIELDKDRAAALNDGITRLFSEFGRPANVHVTVHQDEFEKAYATIRPQLAAQRKPTFAFIDPFGWTGMPFDLVAELVQRPSSEVLINFMFEEVNRFLSHPDQVANFDRLFGGNAWISCVDQLGHKRNQCLRDLYACQLRERARANYVRHFEMKNARNATDYYLFFATNNFAGLKKMKEAMWKVDEGGQFSFSDATDPNQLVMFDRPRFDILSDQIASEFSGRTVPVSEVEHFVVAQTAFRETHFKSQVLKPMECSSLPQVKVVKAKPGRRQGTYPDGTVLEFA
jgi:three-Cys-motif partner protein